jgi:hypothetical protein
VKPRKRIEIIDEKLELKNNNYTMFMMVCMKHYGENITTTYNYVIRWMKIILHGSTSLKWIEPINDLMFLCTNFTSILTIMMDINHYKVCAP